MKLFAISLPALILALGAVAGGSADTPPRPAAPDYLTAIRPIFADNCYSCHGPEKQKNGLRLDRKQNALSGGINGPVFIPGKSAPSTLIKYVSGADPDIIMPPKGQRLSETQVETLRAWIDGGANWPEDAAPPRHWAFQAPVRPPVPAAAPKAWVRNPVDEFIGAEHSKRGLHPRPEASRETLLRRVYFDLIGLLPSPGEIEEFLNDNSPFAYEKVVDRLLDDPRHGERWGRHWMDVWRYSDWAGWTDGGQVRDSQRHIWQWRDWIIESLNADKGYDQMVTEMLAADELFPDDTKQLRATGFLVRNYKMLSREQWMEDTVNHTSKAFLGVTMHCAKCHNHMFDPLTQDEYYQMRAVFEPYKVRIDRVPGETDTNKMGLTRIYDADPKAPTYFFNRGDERQPDTNRLMTPGVPKVLGGSLAIAPVPLPPPAFDPDTRPFVISDLMKASEKSLATARTKAWDHAASHRDAPEAQSELDSSAALASAKHDALLAVLRVEKMDHSHESPEWKSAATEAALWQHHAARLEALHAVVLARSAASKAESKWSEAKAKIEPEGANESNPSENSEKAAKERKAAADKAMKAFETAKTKLGEAEKALAKLDEAEKTPVSSSSFVPRGAAKYPETSSGRRLAFARWLMAPDNPLTARVAVNHIWARHFGAGLVPTTSDFGLNGKRPSHPELLDWLARELMAKNWKMKSIHRLLVTSSTYRLGSTFDSDDARIDQDNLFLWRMNSHRMEAEGVRDNVLYVSQQLDPAMGGPEIDQQLGLTSRRRSVYLRTAHEKQVEFLQLFDGPSVMECYERRPSVVPQQALALINSELTSSQARRLTALLGKDSAEPAFIREAFLRILNRPPTSDETRLCANFLNNSPDKRENLVLVLFNHNDFVTIR